MYYECPQGYDFVGRTIKETAINLLCFVSYYEDIETRDVAEKDSPGVGTVGLPYRKIVSIIKDYFPNSNTSVSSLRWYAVQIRNEEEGYEGHTLPRRRPRR